MSDDDEEPAVELGEATPVEGAPIARVASRLHYGIERSSIVEREGESVIRTPDGPRRLDSILEESTETYFDTRQTFVSTVRDIVGEGPIPTAED
ncbi:MAG: DUF5789 family protein [Natronomonas sp.]